MDTEYLDDEQVIALYNKVRAGRRTWPAGIWSSPAALQYAVTVFDYWIHNVMGWKSWVDARGRINPVVLEQHRLADIVDSVFVPEFGDDWLDFEVVLNESMRLSDDPEWSGELNDRQERVEAAFEHAYEQLIGSPKSPDELGRYHRFRNHLMRMWGAYQEAQAEHDKAEREAAELFWQGLRLVRSTRGRTAEGWSIVNGQEERVGEVTILWGDPHPYCLIVLDENIAAGGRTTGQAATPAEALPAGDEGGAERAQADRSWAQVIFRLEEEILVEEPGVVTYSVWQKGFVGEFYRCADCGELHSQFQDDAGALGGLIEDEDG